MTTGEHDPEQYWDAKARASSHDPLGAVCYGDPARDRCIDRIQSGLLRQAFARLDRSGFARQPLLLDVGCGTGRLARRARDEGFSYQGIDIAAGMVEIARREHPGAVFEKFDGQSIAVGNEAADLVVSMAVVHHNSYRRQEVLLDEMVRVVRPGGAVLLFEGIGARAPTDTGVFFYRPPADWHAAMEQRAMEKVWQRAARYFALEHVANVAAGRLLRRATPPVLPAAASRALLAIGAHIDPWLTAARPNLLHDRLMMIWRKPVR